MNTTRDIAMTNRMRQLRPRDAALFLAVAAVVAVLGVVIGRELGVGQQTGATVTPAQSDQSGPTPQQQSEGTTALTLTLSGPDICETERGRGYSGSELVYDDDGKAIGTRDISTGWDGVAEIPVRWEVTGGTAPYTLVIDNETRDGDGPYEGASGIASVSCAVTSAEVFYTPNNERRFRGDPEIDSGPKTIRATVTDASGVTADASVSIYVILSVVGDAYAGPNGTAISFLYNKGKTYRINGFLMTFSANAVSGGSEETEGGEHVFGLMFFRNGYRGIVGIGRDSGTEIGRRVEKLSGIQAASSEGSRQDDPEAALNTIMTKLVESVGQPPIMTAR